MIFCGSCGAAGRTACVDFLGGLARAAWLLSWFFECPRAARNFCGLRAAFRAIRVEMVCPYVARARTDRTNWEVWAGSAASPSCGGPQRRQAACCHGAEEPKAGALLVNVFSVVKMRSVPRENLAMPIWICALSASRPYGRSWPLAQAASRRPEGAGSELAWLAHI